MKILPENFKSQRLSFVAIFLISLGSFALAWTDAITRDLAFLIGATIFAFLAVGLASLYYRLRRSQPDQSDARIRVPLERSDRRAQFGLLGLILLVGISLFNPSHETVYIPSDAMPAELGDSPGDKGLEDGTRSFTPAFAPREEMIKALPSTVNLGRSLLWALQLLVAFLTAVAVARWARHRTSVIRFACWLIFLHAIALSWIALNLKVDGVENILGHFENANSRFYGPFRYNNFWVAWLVLSLGAGVALLSHYLRKGFAPGIVLVIIGLLSLVPPLLTAQSRSAYLIVGLFVGLSLLRVLFLLPVFVKRSRGQLIGIGFCLVAAVGLIAGIAVVSTWDQWATMENAEAQKIDRMGDTVKQFAELREGKIPDLRPAMTRDGLKAGLMKPVFGWGLGSFEYAHPLVAGPEFTDEENAFETRFIGKMIRVRHIHNDWVQFWVETGTVGLLLLLITIWTFWKKQTRATRGTVMEGGLLTGCLCVAIMALYDFPLNDFAVQCLFAICFGLAIAARRPSRALLKEARGSEAS